MSGPQNESLESNDTQGITKNKRPNISVTFREDDGTILQELSDGTQIQINPDGVRLQLNTDGSIIQSRPDGVIIEAKSNGSRVQSFPDGCQIFTKSDGSVLQVNPDGTAFQTNPNGTIVQTLADRSKVEIPKSAVKFSEPYNPLHVVSPTHMTTSRRRIQEAHEIDRLIDDMFSADRAKSKTKMKPLKNKPKTTGTKSSSQKAMVNINSASAIDESGLPSPGRVITQLSNNIRVFVSSTFRDFGHERDFMMSKTLPIMRDFCFRKGLTITFVDLRWGVTSEESGRGDVIKLCLDEVDACRPFFICMLGERCVFTQDLNYEKHF